jgi:hypothetical protein
MTGHENTPAGEIEGKECRDWIEGQEHRKWPPGLIMPVHAFLF